MPSSVETLIERVMEELHRIVRTETVVGQPVTAGEVTLIPVSKITFGFGAGGGKEGKGQSGTGGGATVEPVAFVVVDAEGKVQILTLQDKEIGLGQIVRLMPEAVEKIKRMMGRKKKRKGEGWSEEEEEERDQ